MRRSALGVLVLRRAYASSANGRRLNSAQGQPQICCYNSSQTDPSASLQVLGTIPPLPLFSDIDEQDSLLQRLCQQGLLSRALEALLYIHAPLHTNTYLCLLKLCIDQKSLVHVKHVHTHITRHHINLSGILGDCLITAFSKCQSITDAMQLSHKLPYLSAGSLAALISACADSGDGLQALELHRRMQQEGVKPNRFIFVGLFKTCGNIQELGYGRYLHAHACSESLTTNVFIGNTLISMYGKCGAVMDAESVFLALSQRDSVSWSALLSAYVEQGEARRTLQLFRQMLEDGVLPNQHGLVSSLQACIDVAEKEEANFVLLEIGKALHALSRARGFQSDVFLETTILTLYGRCGALEEAIHLFLTMRQHDCVAWAAILSLFLEQGELEMVMWLYRVMQKEGFFPNEAVVVVALQACRMLVKRKQASITPEVSFEIGHALHTDAHTYGCALNNLVGTALISMYSACGALTEAEQAFRIMSHRDMVAWNAMLSAFVEQGQGERALCLLKQMQVEGVGSNESTLVLALQACNVIMESASDEGTLTKQLCKKTFQVLHMDACKQGYMSNGIVGNALLCLYGKHGTMAEAEGIFNSLYEHDIATLTAMLLLYIEHNEYEKALRLHEKMLKEGACLDEAAVIGILQACKQMGSLEVCQLRHSDIVSTGHETSPVVALALIDTYGSCSRAEDSDAVFHGLSTPNALLWTACISSHAGGARESVAGLLEHEKLMLEDNSPDELTLTSVLSACCHAGLVTQGLEYFHCMSKEYHLAAEPIHYNILLDLLGRAGDLRRVENMLGNALISGDISSWLCVLGACSSHGNIELAERAFTRAVNLQPRQGNAFIIMSNIHTNELHNKV